MNKIKSEEIDSIKQYFYSCDYNKGKIKCMAEVRKSKYYDITKFDVDEDKDYLLKIEIDKFGNKNIITTITSESFSKEEVIKEMDELLKIYDRKLSVKKLFKLFE